ncbi:hypothetical protein BG011_001487 [Mortierella polycephala]|uniref:Galactose oxidase n=1 Tax=Mortierella polycephala TaxID=41804 RepID=A0A9P6QGH2_9FUNG|nr:hypothetical protein BG011_001487 [Mortierella polycephala]
MLSFILLLALLSSIHAQPHPAGGSAYIAIHDRLYVQGGDLGGSNLVDQFYSLDLSRSWSTNSPTWQALPAGPINAYHSGGFSADMNSFVTFGREVGSLYATRNFINIFSTSTGSWIGTGSTMIADPTRRDMTIASDPSPGGQIYFIGGDAGQSGTVRSNVMDVYNLKSGVVSETTVPLPGPQNLQGGAGAWLPRLKSMLVISGLFDNADSDNTVYLYTPRSGQSSYLSSDSSSNGAVFGGFVGRSSTADNTVYLLDTRTWKWTSSTSDSARGRSYSACAFVSNQLIVWGGFHQNPTSIPNNLPSVGESTMVYSFASKNWVTTFVPSGGPPSSSHSGSGSNGSDSGSRNGNGSSHATSTKSLGVILAIAAVGAILALLISTAVVMLIRRRSRLRRNNNNNNNHAHSGSHSGSVSATTLAGLSGHNGSKKTLVGTTTTTSKTTKEELGMMPMTDADEVPAVSGYSPWEHRGSVSSMSRTNSMGITQTTIVTASGPMPLPKTETTMAGIEEKSHGNYYPISVEREYR